MGNYLGWCETKNYTIASTNLPEIGINPAKGIVLHLSKFQIMHAQSLPIGATPCDDLNCLYDFRMEVDGRSELFKLDRVEFVDYHPGRMTVSIGEKLIGCHRHGYSDKPHVPFTGDMLYINVI